MNVTDVRNHFANEYANGNFCVDRLGGKTIELLGASFIADEPQIFGRPNQDYINRELDWYASQSTNVADIYGGLVADAPAAWRYAANKHGEINSNYGYLIYSPKFHKQYENAVKELIRNQDTRRAAMIYNRPSIWIDFDENEKNDFICTNAVTYYIRDNAVHAVVQMRSNDAWAGYRNDYAWQRYVLEMVTETVGLGTLEVGDIHWQCQNLHVYEKNFYLIDHYLKTGDVSITREEYRQMYGK